LSVELAAELGRAMPGLEQCADRQFWSAYGSCSMLSQEMYFRRAIDRALEVQHSLLNTRIAGALGGPIDSAGIVAAFTDEFGYEAERALELICVRPKQGGLPVLLEARIFLKQLGTMRPLSADGLSLDNRRPSKQRCPEKILIPAPPEIAAETSPPGEAVPEIFATPPPAYDPTKPQPMQIEPDIVEPVFPPETTVP
jgi:ribonuclease I